MSYAKAVDIGYVRFSAPDLDLMETFLNDFGLLRAARTDTTLHMKARDGAPFVHATVKGEPAFGGLSFELENMEALEGLSRATGAPITPIDEPGGGHMLRLTDPDDFRVDAVVRPYGEPIAVQSRVVPRDARNRDRSNVGSHPAEVMRLGHLVLMVKDFPTSQKWYHDHFGMIISDELETEPGKTVGAFLRCDGGEMLVDHHTMLLLGRGKSQFGHAAFEVLDHDALMLGNHHLKLKEYKPMWGIGRHVLGGQIFDYWADPWGNCVEHWIDGYLLDAEWGSVKKPFADLVAVQWGPAAPQAMGG